MKKVEFHRQLGKPLGFKRKTRDLGTQSGRIPQYTGACHLQESIRVQLKNTENLLCLHSHTTIYLWFYYWIHVSLAFFRLSAQLWCHIKFMHHSNIHASMLIARNCFRNLLDFYHENKVYIARMKRTIIMKSLSIIHNELKLDKQAE